MIGGAKWQNGKNGNVTPLQLTLCNSAGNITPVKYQPKTARAVLVTELTRHNKLLDRSY